MLSIFMTTKCRFTPGKAWVTKFNSRELVTEGRVVLHKDFAAMVRDCGQNYTIGEGCWKEWSKEFTTNKGVNDDLPTVKNAWWHEDQLEFYCGLPEAGFVIVFGSIGTFIICAYWWALCMRCIMETRWEKPVDEPDGDQVGSVELV